MALSAVYFSECADGLCARCHTSGDHSDESIRAGDHSFVDANYADDTNSIGYTNRNCYFDVDLHADRYHDPSTNKYTNGNQHDDPNGNGEPNN